MEHCYKTKLRLNEYFRKIEALEIDGMNLNLNDCETMFENFGNLKELSFFYTESDEEIHEKSEKLIQFILQQNNNFKTIEDLQIIVGDKITAECIKDILKLKNLKHLALECSGCNNDSYEYFVNQMLFSNENFGQSFPLKSKIESFTYDCGSEESSQESINFLKISILLILCYFQPSNIYCEIPHNLGRAVNQLKVQSNVLNEICPKIQSYRCDEIKIEYSNFNVDSFVAFV